MCTELSPLNLTPRRHFRTPQHPEEVRLIAFTMIPHLSFRKTKVLYLKCFLVGVPPIPEGSCVDSFKEVYINQNRNCSGKISIYYTNCDSVLNKRDELTLEINHFNPDIIVLTEIFPKSIVSTEILRQELNIEEYSLLLGKETEKARGVCIYVKTGLSYYECNPPFTLCSRRPRRPRFRPPWTKRGDRETT